MMYNNFENKNILITGATGLIGRFLTMYLLDEGANVYILGRDEKKIIDVFNESLNNSRFHYFITDISHAIPSMDFEVDYIFHAASPISGEFIKNKPVDTIMANINGTKNCLELLKKKQHGRMIIFSSATVYGKYDEDFLCDENSTNRADNLNSLQAPYSESKRMIEVMARAYSSQYNVDTVRARISYAYGFCVNPPKTAFYEFINLAMNSEDIILMNPNSSQRDNIYVEDVVEGLLLIAEKGITGEAYNISTGEYGFCAMDKIAQLIIDSVHKSDIHSNSKLIFYTPLDKRLPGIMLDNSKIKALGWEPKYSIEEGIYKTVKDFLNLKLFCIL